MGNTFFSSHRAGITIGLVAVLCVGTYSVLAAGTPVIHTPSTGSYSGSTLSVVTGSGVAGETVTIYSGTTNLGSGMVDLSGDFSIAISPVIDNMTIALTPVSDDGESTSTGIDVTITHDTIAPTITLNGSGTVTVAQGSTYTDAGATCTDNVDATCTVTVDTSAVNTNNTGSYTVTYDVTDTAGNIATQATRTVNVTDQTPPTASVTYSTTGATNQDVTVTLTASEDIADITTWTKTDAQHFTKVISTNDASVVTVNITDLVGNTGSTTYQVTNIDKVAPTASVTYSTTGATNQDVTATIVLSETGTVTNNSGSLSKVFVSNGSFVFNFSDAVGNTGSLTTTVTNIDKTAPVIALNGSASVTLAHGVPYVDAGATWSDNVDGSGSLTGTGTVNSFSAGAYTITYTKTDSAGNVTTSTRTVTVQPMTSGGGSTGGGTGGGSSSVTVVSTPVAMTQTGVTPTGTPTITPPTIQSTPVILVPSDIVATDISRSPYRDSLILAISHGYITNAKKINPLRPITRAEFIKVLANMHGYAPVTSEKRFADVDYSQDLAQYISFGVEKGWVNAQNTNFRPNDSITLGEAQKLISVIEGTAQANTLVTNASRITRGKAIDMLVDSFDIR